LAWSSTPFTNGIEDRYRIDLQPAVVAKLKDSFSCHQPDPASRTILPENFSSVTYYQFQNPTAAWQGLKTSVSSQVDALSAILFSSLLKSALLPYGINDPDKFLSLLDSPVLTARLDSDAAGSLLIAKLRDQTEMRELLKKGMGFVTTDAMPNAEGFRNSDNEFAARFVNGFIVIGSEPEVARYVERTRAGLSYAAPRTLLTPLSNAVCVLTYTNDTDRVRAFVSSIVMARSAPARWSEQTERFLLQLPYSATETTLEGHGIDRITRSALGQFSTLLPLVLTARTKTDENLKP
jgi:hypothetical protein